MAIRVDMTAVAGQGIEQTSANAGVIMLLRICRRVIAFGALKLRSKQYVYVCNI